MASVYDPRGLDFLTWASLTSESFTSLHVEYPTEETDWKLWGRTFAAVPAFAGVDMPDPEYFETWDEWASWFYHLAQDLDEDL